jgi:hypothetical protein
MLLENLGVKFFIKEDNMNMNKRRLFGIVVIFVMVGFAFFLGAVDWVEPPSYIVAGVIGASYENGQASDPHPVAPNTWYLGGSYKTWVDEIAVFQHKDSHWLNYARGGEVSVNGVNQLNNLLMHTTWPDANGLPVSRLEVLVIGNWGNDYIWLPHFDPAVMAALVQNVQNQIALAKSAGVQKIIVTGWAAWDALDLDFFISLFPMLPTHIDEAGYNQAKEYYYNAFSQPNPDYVFVEAWCHFKTFDGVHPGSATSKKAALMILKAVKQYHQILGKRSLYCE